MVQLGSSISSLVLTLVTLLLSLISRLHVVGAERYTEQLDSNGRFFLTWEVVDDFIYFDVEVETLGYIGLGISPAGQMAGADIFIAGLDNGSVPYSGDYHGVGNTAPVLDSQRDWTLISATENSTHTNLRISRLLDTCDDQDLPISDSTSRVIWAIGNTDHIQYHVGNRGSKSVDLIRGPQPEVDMGELQRWDIIVNMTMPSYETTYWCSFHKRMPLDSKHHVVGFEANLINEGGRNHTHHFIAKKCYVPPEAGNASAIFEPWLEHPGHICYTVQNHTVASQYCSEFLFAWAVGGPRTLFPEDVGFPIGESDDDDLYYLMETHFDNPGEIVGIHVETGLTMYYTDQLREHDATLLTVGRTTSESIIVPPNQASNFTVVGHCSSECTRNHLEEDGVRIFNIGLHAHTSGRKLRLRHFRDGVELPWIANDDNFDFNYQSSRTSMEEVVLLPGDQLTYECVYDSTWRGDGSVVIGGLSSRDEMCFAFLWVYGNTSMNLCETYYDYDMNQTMTDFGITNWTTDYVAGIAKIIVLEPEPMRNMNFERALSTVFNWTPEFITEQERKARFGVHLAMCGMRNDPEQPHPVQYVEVEYEYEPESPCNVTSVPGSASRAYSQLYYILIIAVVVTATFGFNS